uniref:Uncharacterized protein n=1 Tax=Alexandrium catenella TaxID=2925 RepID=A0A7S1R104_ALECA|mmetsp:Transcript_42778/g.115375  ORF Transcript_42778/g.115375 Transcript_42778/m.115375 type:complete len:230 (+) Transcript_42778:67-756(+)
MSQEASGADERRSEVLGCLHGELELLPPSEVWRVRVYAGLRRIVHEWRLRRAGIAELLDEESGPSGAILQLLDARALAVLGATGTSWRRLPSWSEHWFLLGVQDFGKHRRLVPPGRFERFDEAMLVAEVNWHARYVNFLRAAHCPDIESLRMAAVRVVQSLDLETSGVEEVRRRLATELQLGSHDFLSLESVEQLLEDASSLRSLGGRGLDGRIADTPVPGGSETPEPP